MRSTENLIQEVVKPQLLEMTQPTFVQIWDDMIEKFEESFKKFKKDMPDKLLEAKGIKLYYSCEEGIFCRSSTVCLTKSGFNMIRGAKLEEYEAPKYLGKIDIVKDIVKKFTDAIEQDENLSIEHTYRSKKENPVFIVRLKLKD